MKLNFIRPLGIAAILLLAAVLQSCSNDELGKPVDNDTGKFTVITIDSCEYIKVWQGSYTGYMFSHKGNCKFCAARYSR